MGAISREEMENKGYKLNRTFFLNRNLSTLLNIVIEICGNGAII